MYSMENRLLCAYKYTPIRIKGLLDVPPAQHFKCVALTLSYHSIDTSILGSLYTLTVPQCDKITDVSALRSIHTLALVGYLCVRISSYSDASMVQEYYGSIHTLTIQSCHDITDVSALGSMPTLTLK